MSGLYTVPGYQNINNNELHINPHFKIIVTNILVIGLCGIPTWITVNRKFVRFRYN
jgi:hypothetical protein